MTPLKVYLIRAVRDWAADSGLTPHVLVDATAAGVQVPANYIDNGRIVLNIHPQAVDRFDFTDAGLKFSARFGGRSLLLEVPYAAVLAVYARENSLGISFPPETPGEAGKEPGPGEPPPAGKPPGKGPTLRIVK